MGQEAVTEIYPCVLSRCKQKTLGKFQLRLPFPFKVIEGQAENGYSARSHDCQPCETDFEEELKLAQQDVERMEKNGSKRRTMVMWKNAVTSVWKKRPVTETQKRIDRMPKIMRAIMEAEGFKTPH